MSELFCTNCGSELEPGSVFCGNCGTPVEDAVDQTAQVSAVPMPSEMQPANAPQAPQQKPVWPIFVVIAVVAVVVVIAIVALTQSGDSSAEKSESNQQERVSISADETSSDDASRSATQLVASPPQFTMVATSSDLAPDDTTSYYGGTNAADGILETAWNEGSSGDGSGEWIEFIADTPQQVSTVSIIGGYPKLYRDGSDVYYKNNRPRQITISYDGGSETFMMQDVRGQFQDFTLARPVNTTFVRITIESVYKGTNYDDCCIAEVMIS